MFKDFLEDLSAKTMMLKRVYEIIYRNGPLSRAELLQKIKPKLTQTTLSRMVDELLKRGYIKESGYGDSAGGRPPLLYTIDESCGYIIGIHITRIRTKIVLFNLLYQAVDQYSFPMTLQTTPTIVNRKIVQTIVEFMEKHHFDQQRLLGIGIASVGPLDRVNGTLSPDQLGPDWVNVPIVESLRQSFPVKIILENGPNAAVVGESTYASLPYKNLLYCVSGWGVGTGVMINGELIRDQFGDVTRNGHMIIDVNGKHCSCGKQGCLAAYMSLTPIIDELDQADPETKWKKRERNEVIDLLLEKRELTEKMILDSAYYYGIGLANLANVYQSEMLILSGPLIYSYPDYYEHVVESTIKHLTEPQQVRITQGLLKDNAAVLGVAVLVFESFF